MYDCILYFENEMHIWNDNLFSKNGKQLQWNNNTESITGETKRGQRDREKYAKHCLHTLKAMCVLRVTALFCMQTWITYRLVCWRDMKPKKSTHTNRIKIVKRNEKRQQRHSTFETENQCMDRKY